MNCIHSHEGGAYCDKHDHGAVTVGCCGEESCPDREVLTTADEYVSKGAVLKSIHNGDIDMGVVTTHEYYLLQKLSRKIDRRIQRVPVSDVAPVRHGRWIDISDIDHESKSCSSCGFNATGKLAKRCNFCPNCGAAMDKEVDNG